MTNEELERFNKANEAIHKVEDEWHYPILVSGGFIPVNKTASGFVRAYFWEHPSGINFTFKIGANADYWRCSTGEGGYGSTLKDFILNYK